MSFRMAIGLRTKIRRCAEPEARMQLRRAAAAPRVRRPRGSSHRRRPHRRPRAAPPRRLRLLRGLRGRVTRGTTHRRLHRRLRRRLRRSRQLLHQRLLRHRRARRLRRRSRRHRPRYRPFRQTLTKHSSPAGGMAIRTTNTRGPPGRGGKPKQRLRSPQRRTTSRRAKVVRGSRSTTVCDLPGVSSQLRPHALSGRGRDAGWYAFRPDRVR